MNNIVDYIDIESRPVKWIYDSQSTNNIIIDNSFQRRYVWTDRDMIALIESILLGCPIPEIYLWQKETNADTGNTVYSIVDGQQRIGAVSRFISDGFALKKSALDFPNNSYAGKVFSKLSAEERSRIWKYKFSIRFIKEAITKDEISDLFLRLNRTNITLNPQELRNAEFNGKFIQLSEKISKLSFWKDFNIFTQADIRRMRDLEFISTLLIFLRMGITEDTNQAAINKAYDLFNEKYPQAKQDFDDSKAILKILENLALNHIHTAAFLNKKTHLYTLFIFGYFLHSSKFSTKKMTKIADNLNKWFAAYDNKHKLDSPSDRTLLEKYRALSQEGSKKKINRIERLEIIKVFCTS